MSNIIVSTSSFDIQGNPHLQKIMAAGIEIITNPHGRKLTETEIGDLLDNDTIGLIAGLEPITGAALARAPALKVISRCGTGTDNIDMAAAGQNGIVIRKTPEAPAAAVAELTIGLMLAALRRIAESDRHLRNGQWYRPQGRLLGGCVVGIVGLGAVGARVAGLCRSFDATVLAVDPASAAPPEGVAMTDINDLLDRSDIVSLHVPRTPDTEGLIDREAILRMRTGAVLVNTSRAAVVDEQALLEALDSGKLAAVALDVFETEPYSGPLALKDNTVLTPHVGSNTIETRRRMEIEAASNLFEELQGAGLIENRRFR